MKSILFLIITGLLLLIFGFIFKDERAVVNIGDTYYVATYLTIAIFLNYILAFIVVVKAIKMYVKKQNISNG